MVLGSVAAERLGITDLDDRPLVWLGGHWFPVVGILAPIDLSPDLDRAALVTQAAAEEYLGYDGVPGTLYVRTDPEWVDAVMRVLPPTVNPENPDQVEVSRPTDALEAKAAAESAFTNLFLGLGAVALLVGGVGIANVMVISVLERRAEIGLRRALAPPASRGGAVPAGSADPGGCRRHRRRPAGSGDHRGLRPYSRLGGCSSPAWPCGAAWPPLC